jgi:hypothetical protein
MRKTVDLSCTLEDRVRQLLSVLQTGFLISVTLLRESLKTPARFCKTASASDAGLTMALLDRRRICESSEQFICVRTRSPRFKRIGHWGHRNERNIDKGKRKPTLYGEFSIVLPSVKSS